MQTCYNHEIHKYQRFNTCVTWPYYHDFDVFCLIFYDSVPFLMEFFFNCYLTASRPTLVHRWGDSLFKFQPEGHPEPDKEIWFLSQTKHTVGLKPPNFHLWCDTFIHCDAWPNNLQNKIPLPLSPPSIFVMFSKQVPSQKHLDDQNYILLFRQTRVVLELIPIKWLRPV